MKRILVNNKNKLAFKKQRKRLRIIINYIENSFSIDKFFHIFIQLYNVHFCFINSRINLI